MQSSSLQTSLSMGVVTAETPAQRRQYLDEAIARGATGAQVREAWLRSAALARQFDPLMVDSILGDSWDEWVAAGAPLLGNTFFRSDPVAVRHVRQRLADRLVREVGPAELEDHAAARLLTDKALQYVRVGAVDGPALLSLLRRLLQVTRRGANPLRETLVRRLAGAVPMTAEDYEAILPHLHLMPMQVTRIVMQQPVMLDLWTLILSRQVDASVGDAITKRLEWERNPQLVLDLVQRLDGERGEWRRAPLPGIKSLAVAVADPHLFGDRMLQLMDHYPTHARAALRLASSACLATLNRGFLAHVVNAPQEHVRAFAVEVMECLPRRSRVRG